VRHCTIDLILITECLAPHVQDKYVLAETLKKIKQFLARGSDSRAGGSEQTEESFSLPLNGIDGKHPSPFSSPPDMALLLPEEPVFTISESSCPSLTSSYSSMSYDPLNNPLQQFPLVPIYEGDDLLLDFCFLDYGNGQVVSASSMYTF
jgi:hypothetical protein